MADLAKWDLRGPVRSIEIVRTFGDRSDRGIVDFRPDGAFARHWHKHSGGQETTETCSYASGRLTAKQFECSDGQALCGFTNTILPAA